MAILVSNSQVANSDFNTFYGANVGKHQSGGFFFSLGKGLMLHFKAGSGLFSISIRFLPNQNLRRFYKVQTPQNSFFGTNQGNYYSNNLVTFTA